MKIFIPIIFLFFFTSQNFAQEYFPLQIGNKWELKKSVEDISPYYYIYLKTIAKDTLMPNGKFYSYFEGNLYDINFIRADSQYIYKYNRTDSTEIPFIKLSAQLKETYEIADSITCTLEQIEDTQLFGINTRILHFTYRDSSNSYYSKEYNISFSDKFGLVKYNDANLNYCKINNVEYGSSETNFNISTPLGIGNSWTFHGSGLHCQFNEQGMGICYESNLSDTLGFVVLKDTLIANKNYSKIGLIAKEPVWGFERNPELDSIFYLRSSGNYLYLYNIKYNTETLLLDLEGRFEFDDTVHFDSDKSNNYNIYVGQIGGSELFGNKIRTISYYLQEIDASTIFTNSYGFDIADSYGFTRFSQLYYIGNDSYIFKYNLVECRINGVDYSINIEPGEEPNAPKSFSLSQNYPNPFNPSTTIEFAVPRQTRVKLTVFDVLGREISVLANDVYSAGNYKATFNGSNLPSGVYLYRLETDSYSQTRKFILLK